MGLKMGLITTDKTAHVANSIRQGLKRHGISNPDTAAQPGTSVRQEKAPQLLSALSVGLTSSSQVQSASSEPSSVDSAIGSSVTVTPVSGLSSIKEVPSVPNLVVSCFVFILCKPLVTYCNNLMYDSQIDRLDKM